MDRTAFRTQYPEFVSCPDALLDTFLAAAALQLDSGYWGSYYDQAQGLLTAHKLVIAPNGQMARLQSDKGSSTYWEEYKRLQYEVTFADRVF